MRRPQLPEGLLRDPRSFLQRHWSKIIFGIMMLIAIGNQIGFQFFGLEKPHFPLQFFGLEWFKLPWLLKPHLFAWWLPVFVVAVFLTFVPKLFPGRSWIWKAIGFSEIFLLLFMYKPSF